MGTRRLAACAAALWTSLVTLALGQQYPYFAPGGALSCTGSCKQQTVNLASGAFIVGSLPAAKITPPGTSGQLTYNNTGAWSGAPLLYQTSSGFTELSLIDPSIALIDTQAGTQLQIFAGAASTPTQAGIVLTPGGGATGNGGLVGLVAGAAAVSGAGGPITINAGPAAGANQPGGSVTIADGPSTGSGSAGVFLATNGTNRIGILDSGAVQFGGSSGTAGAPLTTNGAGAPPGYTALNLANINAVSGALPQNDLASCVINTQSGVTVAYTLVLGDANNCIAVNASALGSVTIPPNASVAFPVGTRTTIIQTGTAATTVTAGGGVTLQSGPLSPILSQYASLTYTQTAIDTWQVSANAGASYQLLSLPNLNTGAGLAGTGFAGTSVATPQVISPPANGASQRDMILSAGFSSGATTTLNNNSYFTSLILGHNGDDMMYSGFANPIFWFLDGAGSAGTEAGVIHLAHATVGGAGTGTGVQLGVDGNANSRCSGASFASTEFRPAPPNLPCVFLGTESGYSFVEGSGNAAGGTPSSVAIAMRAYSADRNTQWLAIGGTTPVKFLQATSTGTSQATTTVGDTNTGSITNLVADNASDTQANGVPILTGYTATTGSIGGGALLVGACASGTVGVAAATTAMVVLTTPVTYPGDGLWWEGYVSAAGTVTVKVCATVATTPTASNYNVRVTP